MTNAIRLCCTYILSENVPMNTNRKFSVFFCWRTHFYARVKMWGNRLTHTVTHTGKCSERAKDERTEKPLF